MCRSKMFTIDKTLTQRLQINNKRLETIEMTKRNN